MVLDRSAIDARAHAASRRVAGSAPARCAMRPSVEPARIPPWCRTELVQRVGSPSLRLTAAAPRARSCSFVAVRPPAEAVAVPGDDTTLVVWHEPDFDAGRATMHARCTGPDGTPIAPDAVLALEQYAASAFRAARRPDGRYAVVFGQWPGTSGAPHTIHLVDRLRDGMVDASADARPGAGPSRIGGGGDRLVCRVHPHRVRRDRARDRSRRRHHVGHGRHHLRRRNAGDQRRRDRGRMERRRGPRLAFYDTRGRLARRADADLRGRDRSVLGWRRSGSSSQPSVISVSSAPASTMAAPPLQAHARPPAHAALAIHPASMGRSQRGVGRTLNSKRSGYVKGRRDGVEERRRKEGSQNFEQ